MFMTITVTGERELSTAYAKAMQQAYASETFAKEKRIKIRLASSEATIERSETRRYDWEIVWTFVATVADTDVASAATTTAATTPRDADKRITVGALVALLQAVPAGAPIDYADFIGSDDVDVFVTPDGAVQIGPK